MEIKDPKAGERYADEPIAILAMIEVPDGALTKKQKDWLS